MEIKILQGNTKGFPQLIMDYKKRIEKNELPLKINIAQKT